MLVKKFDRADQLILWSGTPLFIFAKSYHEIKDLIFRDGGWLLTAEIIQEKDEPIFIRGNCIHAVVFQP